MLKEYCDKCKKEINTARPNAKKKIEISVKSSGYRENFAEITLCEECFKKIEIKDTVLAVGAYKKEEKEPEAVEKLLDVIRELVAECVEEM